jgi:hypothetical protein
VNYNRIFKIDFQKLALLMTPIFWRKSVFIDYINLFVEPLAVVHADFLRFREKEKYKVIHTGQVLLLEKVLNDSFDKSDRRIFISEEAIFDPLFIYSTIENKPVFLGTEYVNEKQAENVIEVDFIINFPIALKPNNSIALINFENRIKAETNYYKLASKRFKILWI